jgi:hypothetical protein
MKLNNLVAIGIALMASPALAAPACTQRTTTGTWAFKCEGELPVGVPTRSLGTCVTSEGAYWQCKGQINAAGNILQQEVQGQASNHSDCTGTIVYDQKINGANAGQLEINYVILDNGNAIWGLPLNSGGVLACTLQRLSREPS